MAQLRDDQLLEKIALALKQLREASGKSQEEVYNEINIHIGRIETAKSNVSVSTIAALCDYFGVKVSEFFRRVEGV
jgi:transcriptional regulator with XRE-family HTH domain